MSEEFADYLYMTIPELRKTLKEKFESALELFDDDSKTIDLVNDLDHEIAHIPVIFEKLSEKVTDNPCKNCHGKGFYIGESDVGTQLKIKDYGEHECEDCNGTGIKEIEN